MNTEPEASATEPWVVLKPSPTLPARLAVPSLTLPARLSLYEWDVFMSVWDWVESYAMQALAEGDEQRLRLTELHSEAYEHRQSDPDRMLALYEEGRRLAQALNEPWWVLFYDDWRLETLIYYKVDYRQVIDLAIATTLELHKPAHQQHPLRFAIWCNLVAAYLCVDPRGYEPQIREALEYMQREVPTHGEEKFLLLAREHWLAYELNDMPRARELSLQALNLADNESDTYLARHHAIDTYTGLCRVLFRQQDWQELALAAATGEELARWEDYNHELACFLLWQALCSRRQGNEERAKRLCRRGTSMMSRLGMPPGDGFYDALAMYHELGGKLDLAWQARQRESKTVLDRGALASETEWRIKRCRLLVRMGLPVEEECAAAREAANRLRKPEWYLGELERALSGTS